MKEYLITSRSNILYVYTKITQRYVNYKVITLLFLQINMLFY